ncbi:MAG: hypothetical protein ACLFTQ_03090 [Candidatus Aenigmatarchaeota archaeon]
MEVLQVSTVNKQGKVTIPKSIRKKYGVLDRNGRLIWYKNEDDKLVVEIKPSEEEE